MAERRCPSISRWRASFDVGDVICAHTEPTRSHKHNWSASTRIRQSKTRRPRPSRRRSARTLTAVLMWNAVTWSGTQSPGLGDPRQTFASLRLHAKAPDAVVAAVASDEDRASVQEPGSLLQCLRAGASRRRREADPSCASERRRQSSSRRRLLPHCDGHAEVTMKARPGALAQSAETGCEQAAGGPVLRIPCLPSSTFLAPLLPTGRSRRCRYA